MENAGSLSNFLAQSIIVIFLVLLAVVVLRTLMLPLGVIFLSAVRGGRGSSGPAPTAEESATPSSSDATKNSVPPTAE
jgi:hypothetical protein